MPMATKSRRKFIVLDGVEGCGKSTQCKLLAEALRKADYEVVETFEPGGTEIGKVIRSLLLDPAYQKMTIRTEALLLSAARSQHCFEVIAPALEAGKVVVCDRYDPAFRAYQGGLAGKIPQKSIDYLVKFATCLDPLKKPLMPDLVIILDLDPKIGFEHKGDEALDRIELKGPEYHQWVRDGFLEYADQHPEFCVVVAADGTIAEVHQAIIAVVNKKFEELEWNIRPVLC